MIPRRFYIQPRRKGWEICDRQCFGLPVHDDAPDGKDAPLVFPDCEIADQVCEDMNRRYEAGETIN